VLALAPVFIAIMGRSEVYLPAEVQQLLFEDWPECQALGYLQPLRVERDFQGSDEVSLRDSPHSAVTVGLSPPVIVTLVNVNPPFENMSVTGAPTPVLSTTKTGLDVMILALTGSGSVTLSLESVSSLDTASTISG
jgi:hypothetical protein